MQIQLTQGFYTTIDTDDFERVSEHSWCYYKGYAEARMGGRKIYLSRFIMDTPDDFDCDHINHDRLDNRKGNLRNCTTSQNMWNMKKHVSGSSKYKGVSWDAVKGKWRAEIEKNPARRNLGRYVIEADAALAYNRAAIELFGEFALLNVISED
jgi:hypothetical protein